MFTKKMACLSVVALSAVCLLALPGVGRADTVADWYPSGGTVTWTSTSGGTGDGLRTVTDDMAVARLWSGGDGTLNQTGGTITINEASGNEVIIGQVANGIWNMSGTASMITTGGTNAGVILGNAGTGTLTLTDSATATIGALDFRDANASLLLLSGHASINATDLINFNPADYISFASGSTATLTVASESLSSYQTLVSGGYIRVNGVAQSDFSKFQVTGDTLSLATPEPGALVLLGTALAGLLAYAWRKRR